VIYVNLIDETELSYRLGRIRRLVTLGLKTINSTYYRQCREFNVYAEITIVCAPCIHITKKAFKVGGGGCCHIYFSSVSSINAIGFIL
jgi:hypothetical protein